MKVRAVEHWSEIDANPISPSVMKFAKESLGSKYSGPIFELDGWWEKILKGKKILDVGVVEHSLEFTSRPGWKHRKFVELGSLTVGVDIISDAVTKLCEIGYDVRLCDATSDVDLGERFDVVYIGDVIEHVNNPVRLLEFAARHLRPEGRVIATTPCPFWWKNIQLMIMDSTFIGNVDHIRWVCPVHALELARRAGIILDSYHTFETNGHTFFRKILQRVINRFTGRTELFTWAYAYSFTLKEPK